MRTMLFSLMVGLTACIGCNDRGAAKPATEPIRGHDATTDSTPPVGMTGTTPTGPGESDRAETTLRERESSEPPLPSSASPDIDTARGER